MAPRSFFPSIATIAAIIAGTIDNCVIGGTTRAAGNFTTGSFTGGCTNTSSFQSTRVGAGIQSGIYVTSTSPAVGWKITGQPADSSVWDTVAVGQTLQERIVNDANASTVTYRTVTRNGMVIVSVVYNAPLMLSTALSTNDNSLALATTSYVVNKTSGGLTVANIPNTSFPAVQATFRTTNSAIWIRGASTGPMATLDKDGNYWVLDIVGMNEANVLHFGADPTNTAGCDAAFIAAVNAGAAFDRDVAIPTGNYKMQNTFDIYPGTMLKTSPHAVLAPANANPPAIGIRLNAGNYTSTIGMRLPNCGGYSDCAIELNGASLVNMIVGYVGSAQVGVRMIPATATSSVLDSKITLNSISNCTYACVYKSLGGGNTMQGNVFVVNFVTACNKILTYQGYICSCDGNRFEAEAIDITVAKGGGWSLGNEMIRDTANPSNNGASVPRCRFECKTWWGGAAHYNPAATGGQAQIIKGSFTQLEFLVKGTFAIRPVNYTDDPANIVGAKIVTGFNGTSNNAALLSTTQGVANFNLTDSDSTGQGVPSYLDTFMFTYTVPTGAPITAGSTITLYAYVIFTDHFNHPWHVYKVNNRTTASFDGVYDNSGTVANELIIPIVNRGTTDIPPGTVINGRLERRM